MLVRWGEQGILVFFVLHMYSGVREAKGQRCMNLVKSIVINKIIHSTTGFPEMIQG